MALWIFIYFTSMRGFDQNMCSSKGKLVGDLHFDVIVSGNSVYTPIKKC